MTTLAAPVSLEPRKQRRPNLDHRLHPMIRVTIAAIIGAERNEQGDEELQVGQHRLC